MRIAPTAPRLATKVLIPRSCDLDQRPEHAVNVATAIRRRSSAQQNVDRLHDLGDLSVNQTHTTTICPTTTLRLAAPSLSVRNDSPVCTKAKNTERRRSDWPQ